jgi:4-amino-4-deoxy-L-arabinose transferase-like glycosyltransferase
MTSTEQRTSYELQNEGRMQQRMERRNHNQQAGVPVWGVLLVLVGVIALFGNFGIGLGWVFGLALGAWFVYLGVRGMQAGQQVNWWLVGLGLLIGLGALSSGFADTLVFPIVLVLVGLGILGEHYLTRQNQSQS